MRPRFLLDLPPGTRFVVAEQPSLTGRLIRANHCTAYVAYDQAPEVVRIGNREFVAERSKTVGVTPRLRVFVE